MKISKESKSCSVCKELKPISKFHVCSTNADGHRAECKKCHTATNRKRVYKIKKEKDFYKQFLPI